MNEKGGGLEQDEREQCVECLKIHPKGEEAAKCCEPEYEGMAFPLVSLIAALAIWGLLGFFLWREVQGW